MSKGQYRGKRKRGFDDDDFQPQGRRDDSPSRSFSRPPREMPMSAGPEVDATVKWFNPEKGFGFVELGDGSGDAFLHIAVLQGAGHESVEPGTKLKVQVGQGQKGRQVTAVISLDASSAVASPPRSAPRPAGGPRQRPDASSATSLNGTVKWFNPDKGFGFVKVDDGGKDVFVHISVLERAGLKSLAENQSVSMQVVQGQKGREAISISLG